MFEISVIIPTYNRANYLEELLNSILKMKDVSVEIIIINDNSSDNTDAIIRDKYLHYDNIRYLVNQHNEGCGQSRRKGLAVSRGEYIVFADDDDYYTDYNFYRNGIKILQASRNIACVAGNSKIYYHDKNYFVNSAQSISGLIVGSEFLNGFMTRFQKPKSTFSAIFKKTTLIQSGLLASPMVNDASIYMRALLYGDIYILDNTIGVYRVHNHNISNNLTSRFIIDNLDEKLRIYQRAKRLSIYLDTYWLSRQFDLTASYYFNNNKYTLTDILKIVKWGMCNNALCLKHLIRILPSLIIKK